MKDCICGHGWNSHLFAANMQPCITCLTTSFHVKPYKCKDYYEVDPNPEQALAKALAQEKNASQCE